MATRAVGAWMEPTFLVGLGGVFLANAAVAVTDPAGFEELVATSPMGGLLEGAWLAPAIAANDLLTGAAIIASHRLARIRRGVLAWAGVWLLAVTLLKLFALA